MSTLVFPSLDVLLTNRRVQRRDDGSFAEDSYDYGVWWRDRRGGVYRLTWIGSRMRDDPADAGELYLVRLSGPICFSISSADLDPAESFSADAQLTRGVTLGAITAGDSTGSAELLCLVAPTGVEGDEDGNVEAILEGWADVCGSPDSVEWVRARAREAVARGDALSAREVVRVG